MTEDRKVVFVPRDSYGEVLSWVGLVERALANQWQLGEFTRDEDGNKRMPNTPKGHASFYNGFRDTATLFFRNW
jgi:hypothetical protein